MHYYQHHIGDFVKDTANLSDHQLATYMRMIWAYYSEEKPFANEPEDIAFAMRSDEKTVCLILRHYFKETADGWRHSRCDREISEFHGKKEKASASANARWSNAKKQAPAVPTQCDRNANALKSDANQEPITNNQEPEESKALVPSDDATGGYSIEFEQFWKAYPKRDGGNSKRAAFKAWKARLRAGVKYDDLILSANRYAEQMAAQGRIGTSFVKQASTFLGPDDHWQEAMTSNVHPIAIARNGNRPALKPGQWYHPDWNDKDPSTHTICSEETHERATSYAFAWLKKQAWYKP